MKRQFTLLLASVLVVFALTACGGNDKDTNQDNNDHENAASGRTA